MAVFSGNGAAGTPSFTFSSDTNTGIFRGGTDILSFSTGGTERAHLDDVGNFELGGTPGTSPATTLFAAGGAEFSDLVHVVNDVAFSNGATSLAESYSLAGFRVTPSNDSSNCINVGPRSNTSDMYIQGSNNPGSASRDFYLQPFGGNINIGVTEILLNGNGSAYFGDQVDIGGTSASPNINLNEDGGANFGSRVKIQRSDNDGFPALFVENIAGTSVFRVNNNGDLGVGGILSGGGALTFNPEVRLNTDGTASFEGSIRNGTLRTISAAGAWDLNTGNLWQTDATAGSNTIAAPTNATAGMSGLIFTRQAITTWTGSNFDFPGGSAPSVPANSVIPFWVLANNQILIGTATEAFS